MKTETHEFDFVVVGGGLSGICAALTAARAGVRTALVQDRPVLGGNASKELRVPPVGATGCNYLYSRETGIIEEIQLRNLRENPSGSHERWDLLLQTFVYEQPNLTCYLDTVVQSVSRDEASGRLESVTGFTLGSELYRVISAPLFADCTGDGVVAMLAGAEFRMGKEARSEHGESNAPQTATAGGMGMSIQFRAREMGRDVPFRKPAWVDLDLTEEDFGPFRDVCGGFLRERGGFWWLEFGGNLDTIHETWRAKRRILEIVYAVWDFIKNKSRIVDEVRTFELDWVGSIPGKRESRRIMGDHVLTQGDVENAVEFTDAIAFGGWGFDDHPGDGFLAVHEASYHVKHASPYNIPLRSLYCAAVPNLFLAGRDISVTHVALSSTRVMLTCAQTGEAVGAAAAACLERSMTPRELAGSARIRDLQHALRRADHHLHDTAVADPDDLAPHALVTASSALSSPLLEESCGSVPLEEDVLWQFPVVTDRLAEVQVLIDAADRTEVAYVVHRGAANGNTFPDGLMYEGSVTVGKGAKQWVGLPVSVAVEQQGWHYLELKANPSITVHTGQAPPVGLAGFTVARKDPIRPNPYSRWTQLARNSFVREAPCLRVTPDQPVYAGANVTDPYARPWRLPHLWISEPTDFSQPEWVQLEWKTPQTFSQAIVLFDSSLDFTFYQSWLGYPDNVIPSVVTRYDIAISDDGIAWTSIATATDNYLRRRHHSFAAVTARFLRLTVHAARAWPRAQVYALRVLA